MENPVQERVCMDSLLAGTFEFVLYFEMCDPVTMSPNQSIIIDCNNGLNKLYPTFHDSSESLHYIFHLERLYYIHRLVDNQSDDSHLKY